MNATATGLFGKIPAHGDFVRLNAASPASHALDEWHQQALDTLARSGASLPPMPVCFLFRPAGSASALLGAFVRSEDRVGRSFPLSVFAPVEGAALASFPALPMGAARFLRDATALLSRAARLGSAAELVDAARAIAPASADELQLGRQLLTSLFAAGVGGTLEQTLLPDVPAGQAYYALSTFVSACAQVRGREPSKPGIILDCPAPGDVWVGMWLELARRLLGWSGTAPPFFWTDGPAARLLLCLGPPSTAALLALAHPEAAGAKRWPLVTAKEPAIQAARAALSAHQREVLDRPASIAELLDAFGPA